MKNINHDLTGKSLREQLQYFQNISREKRMALAWAAKAEAQLIYIPWLDFVLRKSNEHENGFFIDLWNQSPQYRIVYDMGGTVRHLPIFLTDTEALALKLKFDNAVKFCDNTNPFRNEVEAYTVFINDLFKKAIRLDKAYFHKPYKFYSLADGDGIVFCEDESTAEEIELHKDQVTRFNQAQKQKSNAEQPKKGIKSFFRSLYSL